MFHRLDRKVKLHQPCQRRRSRAFNWIAEYTRAVHCAPPNHLAGHAFNFTAQSQFHSLQSPYVYLEKCDFLFFYFLFFVISDSLGHMLKCTTTFPCSDTLAPIRWEGVKSFQKFKTNYILPDLIHSVHAGNCWLILKWRVCQKKVIFQWDADDFALTFIFKRVCKQWDIMILCQLWVLAALRRIV